MINSVWSSYGHTFMSTDSPEHESCLTCGALFDLHATPNGPHDGEYTSADGSEPIQCTRNTAMVHGFMGEKYCMDPGCADGSDCEHVRATDNCNCLQCDS